MSKKLRNILIFVLLPIVIVAAVIINAEVENKKAVETNTNLDASLSSDDKINQMLLEEYQKSQSTRSEVEQSTEISFPFTEGVAEIAEAYSEPVAEVSFDGDLSESDEDIIAAAEENARKEAAAKRQAINDSISLVTGSTSTGEYVVDLTEEELLAEHPLFLQYDPRWASYPYGRGTMKSSACGPTCFSMVIIALTDINAASPPRVATYSMEHNYYVAGAGTSHQLFLSGAADFGLYCNEITTDEATMKSHLDNGEMLILSVKNGNFTSSGAGHFIVIYGYDSNGFMVNDPGSAERSKYYWTYSTISPDIVKIYALGKN